MSPRRFDRRTYMIVAPGWSALALKAAMSASSASTTIRSASPFTLSPTVDCHDIFSLPQSYVTNEALTGIDRHLSASSISLCQGVVARASSARTPICTKIESGADTGSRGITCYMVRPRALHVLALVNDGASPSQVAIQSPQHK